MSTIKSDNSDLTINASGTSKDIKFQADGTEVASISNTGILTATSFVGDGSTLSNVGVDGIVSTANATAITIDSNENVGIGVTPEISTNTTGLYVGSRTAVVNWGNGSYFPHNAYESSSSWKYRDTAAAGIYSRNNNGDHVFEVAPSGTADAAISFTTGFEVLNSGKARAKNGIMFGTDTSDSNTLDDYEEGSWTPVLGDTNGANTWSGAATGYYTKVGNICWVYCVKDTTGSQSNSSGAYVSGLPFIGNGRNQAFHINGRGCGRVSGFDHATGMVEDNTSKVSLRSEKYGTGGGGGQSNLPLNTIQSDGSVVFEATYRVD